MASIFKKKDERFLVPLWSNSYEAACSSENRALKPKSIRYEEFNSTVNLYNEFREKKEIGVAIELLNSATLEDKNEEAVVAAKFIISGFKLPSPIIELANKTLGILPTNQKEVSTDFEKISAIRRHLIENPKDCLSWFDLARLYTSLGENKAAKKCITIGISISDKHRWATRVAARFFYNLEEYDRAHSILLKHPYIKDDPWLISAEIAVSSGMHRQTKLWGQARKILDNNIQQFHLSELQSSAGTLELNNGAIKKAKKLFISSLTHPNSNILAQAKWAERTSDIKGLVDENVLNGQRKAFEAKCWEAYSSQEMGKAFHFCLKWMKEEPYTTEPIIHATYLASLLDDYQQALDINKKGLQIDPSNETLKLNKIFSEISLLEFKNKEITEEISDHAIHSITELCKGKDNSIIAHSYANLGLIYYKTGDIYQGKEFYERSIDLFKSLGHPSMVLAQLNHLREALLSKAPWANEQFLILENFIKTGGVWSDPSALYYLKKLKKVQQNIDNWREHLMDNSPFIINDHIEVKKEVKNVRFDFDPKNPTIWILPKKK